MTSTQFSTKYILGDEIGKGAYSRVFKGFDKKNGGFVAIKQIPLEKIVKDDDLNPIMLEIDLLKNLNHKNIVKYIGSWKTKTHLHIALEYVENGSLANNVKPKKFGPLPESLVAVYIAQVLEGLVYLHEQGVIHRDIKGANILTTKEGLVKLADFGVATKLNDEAEINTLEVAGSPYWMAPEVIELSGVCAASDIWSVGCTVIELLTSKPPYFDLEPNQALFRTVQDDRPPIPDGLSQDITDFLLQCFKKDSRQRPDAKTLLSHPWILNSRRALQSSLRKSEAIKYKEAAASQNAVKTPSSIGENELSRFSVSSGDASLLPKGNSNEASTSMPPSNAIQGDPPVADGGDPFLLKHVLKEHVININDDDLAVEFRTLVSSLRPYESEDSIISSCEKLLDMFRLRAEHKSVFVAQHGFLPLLDLLSVSKFPVTCSVLQLINEIIKDNTDFQENACLVGLIPMVMSFVGTERDHSEEMRMEATNILLQICQSRSSLTLQTFIACGGIPILVGFIEEDYAKHRKMVHLAIDGMLQVFKHKNLKNDFCRIAAKNGVLPKLINTLVSLNASALLASISGGSQTSVEGQALLGSIIYGDVASEYLEKVADLLLVFAQADTTVKSHMCGQSLRNLLFLMPNYVERPILLKILECINHLSTDPNCLESLESADAIKHLIRNLDLKAGDLVYQIHHEVLSALINLCKINKRRQDQAAEHGIIPHLKHFIMSDSPLKQYALPLICDMARASHSSRERLIAHGGLDMYMSLLDDESWSVIALDSISVFLGRDNDSSRKVEQELLKEEAVHKLVNFFQSCPERHFVHILEPFLKIVTKSSKINMALAGNGLTSLLISKLHHQDAIVRLSLLKLIRAVYEHHPNPKQMIVENNLARKLEKLIEERRDGQSLGDQVLVKQMATSLLKGLHINTVL